ncbi:MAG: HAD hydrolase-like protein [Clostridia bacterium]|nr:HAD hydrolase-like protein [Clostridia bacterium]MBP5429083.1 HAD hydrolase-like protein [Clostridia bacterium]
MKTYSTVLFDLDGTLIDTSEGVIGSAFYALETLGYPHGGFRDYLPFLGPPLSYGFGVVCGVKESDIPRAIQIFRGRYIGEEWYLRSAVYDGIPELLAALRRAGYRVAVTTSKVQEAAEKILKRLGLFDFFDLVVGSSDDPGRATKAGVLRTALGLLGVGPGDAVLVGDRYFDAEGAAAEGVDCIAALWGFGEKEEFDPYPVVGCADTPAEVGAFLPNVGAE